MAYFEFNARYYIAEPLSVCFYLLWSIIEVTKANFKKKQKKFFRKIFFSTENSNWYENAPLVLYEHVLGKTQL